MKPRRFPVVSALLIGVLLAAGLLLPTWRFVFTVALARALVVLGLMLLMRTGLVSFGQGLYFCVGGYTVGMLNFHFKWGEALLLLPAAAFMAGLVAALLGFLLARYRDIFFAMLSLALSMILYGLLVRTTSLGGSDGFNITAPTLVGRPISGLALFGLACMLALIAGWVIAHFLQTPHGKLAPAIRDNEIRVEYLGASARRIIHENTIIAAALAGLGGALTALGVGHIDPEMAYWTVSGEFVFIAVLGGLGSVFAPFIGALLFETIRTFAYQYSPNSWQLVLGTCMLALILFLPGGLWSLGTRFSRGRRPPIEDSPAAAPAAG